MVTSRLKMSSHQLHATQASGTVLRVNKRKHEPQATQNVQSQATRMPDRGARDSRGLWGKTGEGTRRLEVDFH